MRGRDLLCTGALLIALVATGVLAAQVPENPSLSKGRAGRFQRKVLVSSRRVSSTAAPDLTPSPSPPVPSADPVPADLVPTEKSPSPASDLTPAPSSPPTSEQPSTPAPSSETKQPAAPAATAKKGADSSRATRSAAIAEQDRWIRFVKDYVSGADMGINIPDWSKTPLKVELPVVGQKGGRSSKVPVFVLPVPVPISVDQCPADGDRRNDRPHSPNDEPRQRYPEPPRLNLRRPIKYDESRKPTGFEKPRRPPAEDNPRDPSYLAPYEEPSRRPSYEEQPRRPSYEDPPRRPSYEEPPRRPSYEDPPRRPSYDEPPRRPSSEESPRRPNYEEPPRRPSYEEPPRRPSYEEPPRRPSYDEPPRRPSYDEPPRRPNYEEPPRRPSYEEPRPAPLDESPREPFRDDYDRRPVHPLRPSPFIKPDREPYSRNPPTMRAGAPVSSDVLLSLFRKQQPRAPHLPPVLTRHRRHTEPPPPLLPLKPGQIALFAEPPRPRFDRPLVVRGELTVHRADYTEPYIAWWDPVTGNSRVDFHDGATRTYRTVQGGRVQRVAMNYDRTGEKDVRRCSTMQSSQIPLDLMPPVLPQMELFSFHSLLQMGDTPTERWKHTVTSSGPNGEQITHNHDMLLTRLSNATAVPLLYEVSVDSSVLGKDCDRYLHRYLLVQEFLPDANRFNVDINSECDTTGETWDMAAVDPMREFTLPQQDPKYDELFEKYTVEYERKYVDHVEAAIRKNLLTQTSRFVSAGNREGASFEMGLNFLSDRLQAEVEVLLGVTEDAEHTPSESFPHPRRELRDLADSLPDQFDWREEGGVSAVKHQDSCSSCWAFAVTGAVEGALFRRTRRLVPLSTQCLVDCAKPYGGNGCKPTWPSHAYDYVQDRGLPAEKEYIPYLGKVLECQDKIVKPVTQISAHVNVTQHSVPALKIAIREHAPSVVIIDSTTISFRSYKTGIFYDDRCAKNKAKHAVLAVGWGEERKEPHFILKNSWSASWGEGGYVRMHGPSNTCGVLSRPSYPRLEGADVLRDLDRLAAPSSAGAGAASGRSAAGRSSAGKSSAGRGSAGKTADDDDYY
ncbi:hypothetical protein evm_013530 [Chilo suppressalis]|nr:hypothetical protein evm_013530 [Chilo suppressalis]